MGGPPIAQKSAEHVGEIEVPMMKIISLLWSSRRRFNRRQRRSRLFTSTLKLQTKLGQRLLAPTNLTCNRTGFASNTRNRTVRSCNPSTS